MDIKELVRAYGSAEPAVSVKVLGTYSSASMYVHPDGGYARFLLMGLRPETQYTVIASYGITTKYDLGDAGREVFRTDYARLAGIETSGLTHTEATVTVSLAAAGLDRGCCFRFYPHSNKDEAETEYTYYLRYKPSDDTVWSDPPVGLTFSDFTADARLTSLDPGTDYDVEVAETADFMPPLGSAGSYNGTMTVATDNDSGIGFDQVGFGGFIEPYGSLSPATFKLGGVDHSIVELLVRIPSFLIPQSDFGKLFLKFDRALPDGIEFTLTLGTEEFDSSDATVSDQTYSWAGGPSLTNGEAVTVELDFTGVVPFREGTTLEELGAFTTPTMPPTVAFDAEMTTGLRIVGVESIVGFNTSPSNGSLSDSTFEVGGVEYTVKQLEDFDAQSVIVLSVSPAGLQLELETGGVTYGAGDAQVSTSGGTSTYRWSRTGTRWSFNTQVDVKLHLPLINICSRPSAVADAIVKATPSFDFCHMTSQLDLANITRLDLSGVDLGGLSPQLPPGTFDGLHSLETLDISDTHLLSLSIGIFEGLSNLTELDLSDTLLQRNSVPVGAFDGLDNLEVLRIANAGYMGRGINLLHDDILGNLGNLRELDVRPSQPHLAAPRSLMPLASLTTYNGASYTRPADPPKNLTANMEDFPGDSSRKKVTLTWEAPDGVSGITGYRILRTDTSHPLKVTRRTGSQTSYDYDYSRYAYDIATVGSSTLTYVHGASDGIKAGRDGEFTFTYYVAAITAGGDSFPVKVFVSP